MQYKHRSLDTGHCLSVIINHNVTEYVFYENAIDVIMIRLVYY